MKRIYLGCITLVGLGAAVVLSGGRDGVGKTFFPTEERNPVTHLRWNDNRDDFQFVVVSDRTGGHRAEVFSQAVDKINLLQPEFVLSVGDLIEGGKASADKIAAEWKELDGFVKKLNMPFFYVPGNHDVATKDTTKAWQDKLGRRHYHFVYRGVLFLILNTDDMPEKVAIGKEQIAYVQKTLKENADVRWTIVALHRPLWRFDNGAKNGFGEVEKALAGRSYTIFCGHEHHYVKAVRNGMNYYQLATTGGSSMMRGVEFGEFDHLVWVTMKKDGPLIANLTLDAIQAENLKTVKTGEPGVSTAKRLQTHPVTGRAYFEGTPMPGAVVTFVSDKGAAAKATKATGVVEADGSFQLTTYKAFDGVPAGEYLVSVAWREATGKGPSLLPAKYASPSTSGLRAVVVAGKNDLVFELKK